MSDFAQFKSAIDVWLAEVEQLAVGVARGLSAELFNYAVRLSPQYSGDFSGNWKYSVGAPDTSFEELGLMASHYTYGSGMVDQPFLTGSAPAIRSAMGMNAGRDRQFTQLGPTIFISNSAAHDEHYAWLIENNAIKFRPGNAGAVAARAMGAVMSQLPGGQINRAQALLLSQSHIGVGV